jgi:integrase
MSNPGNGIDKLLRSAKKDGQRAHLMILLSYEGALRVSELIHIKVCDFNFDSGSLTVIPIRRRNKSNVECKVSSEVAEAIRDYVAALGIDTTSFLFPGRTKKSCMLVSFRCPGGHISKREVQLIFDRVAGAAGVKEKGRGIQTLKHARLTDVAKETNDPDVIQQIGRYGSSAMGARYIVDG